MAKVSHSEQIPHFTLATTHHLLHLQTSTRSNSEYLKKETVTDNLTQKIPSQLPDIKVTPQNSLLKLVDLSAGVEVSSTRNETRVEKGFTPSSDHSRHSKVRNQKELSVDTKICRPDVNFDTETVSLVGPDSADAENPFKETQRDMISVDGEIKASARKNNRVKCSTRWLKCHSIADFSLLGKSASGMMKISDPAPRDDRLSHPDPNRIDSGSDIDGPSSFTFPDISQTAVSPSKHKGVSYGEKQEKADSASASKQSKSRRMVERFFSFFPCVNKGSLDSKSASPRKHSSLRTHANVPNKPSKILRDEKSEKLRPRKLSITYTIGKRTSADPTGYVGCGSVRRALSVAGGNSSSCQGKTDARSPELSSRKSSVSSFYSAVDDYGRIIPTISLSMLATRRASTITWSLPPVSDDCDSTHTSDSTPTPTASYHQPTEDSQEDIFFESLMSTKSMLSPRSVSVAPKVEKCQHTLRRFIANEMASRESNYSRNLQTLSESFRIPLAAAAVRAAEMEQNRARKPTKKPKARTVTPSAYPATPPRKSNNDATSTNQSSIPVITLTSEYKTPTRPSLTISTIPVPMPITSLSPMTDVKDPRCLPDWVKELAATSRALAIDLQRVCQNWSNTNSGIGEILLRHMGARKFDVYLRYCRDYTSVIDAVRRLKKSSFVFKETYATDANPEKNRFTIANYLILPIQQLGRYPLWLRDLRKATPEDHPDYPGLVLAERQMQDLARVANSWVNEDDLR